MDKPKLPVNPNQPGLDLVTVVPAQEDTSPGQPGVPRTRTGTRASSRTLRDTKLLAENDIIPASCVGECALSRELIRELSQRCQQDRTCWESSLKGTKGQQ